MKKFTLLKMLLLALITTGSLNLFAVDFTLVNNVSSLAAGDEVLIVNTGGTQAISTTQNANNRGQAAVTVVGSTITDPTASVAVFTVGKGTNNTNYFTFQDSNGYLYAASSSSNYLRSEATVTVNSEWEITIDANGVATVKATGSSYTRNWMRYNSGSSLFSCYASGQVDIKLYKKASSSCTAPNYSFASTTVNKLATDAPFTNAFTTNNTSPTVYSSSNTAVATVNSSTGEVAIVGPGTSTISVTQVADATYCAVSANYTLNVTSTAPTITVTESTVPPMSATVGSTDTKTINVSGTNLTGPITLSISGTDAAQFSVSPTSIAQTGGTAPNTVVTITYAPNAAGTHNATLDITSAGAGTVTRALTGTATAAALAAPVATDATNISQTSFTANWGAVTGATSYDLSVYTKTVTPIVAPDLFISEYGEGSANNKYIELYNGTGAPIDLTGYSLKQSYNGAGWPASTTAPEYLALTGTVQPNDVFVIAASTADPTILAQADLTVAYSSTNAGGRVPYFTGNDAIGLFKNEVLIDVFGDPSSNATIPVAGFVTYGQDHTIVRKPTIYQGNTNWTTSSGTNTTDSEWIGYAQDTWTYLGTHTMNSQNTTLTPVSGSPFTGITGTSYNVTGLSNTNTYYYTVVAKDATRTSAVSNEITVNLLATGLENAKTIAVYAHNGHVFFSTVANEPVAIYNANGQKIISKLSVDGLNKIAVNVKGVLVIKVGNKIGKVIL